MYAIRPAAYAAAMSAASATAIPEDLATRAGQARRVAVLTGAGISAESGVPTFRDAQTGVWARFDPMQLATPEAFARDPERVWDWYAWRRELVGRAEPNAGHLALARWEQAGVEVTVATQNVDGLHRRAGSRRVIALHGDITRTLCGGSCGEVTGWESDTRRPPRCPNCEAPLRPGVASRSSRGSRSVVPSPTRCASAITAARPWSCSSCRTHLGQPRTELPSSFADRFR